MEIGLCLELSHLNLLANPLDGPFPSSIVGAAADAGSSRVGGGGAAEDGGNDDAPGPSTWQEVYVGPRTAMCQVGTKGSWGGNDLDDRRCGWRTFA